MLSIERKRTEKVDFVKPLTKYIKEQFSKEEASSHELQITSLQTMREDVRNLQDKTETSKDMIWKYYSILASLELRFPISENNVRISFPWTDSYKQRKYSLYSLYFERSAILFNYGSILSQIGATQNRSTVDGIKKACNCFQSAAGIYNSLREYISLHPECFTSPDFSADSLNMLSSLMIAQAQECIYEKAAMDNLSEAIQAKLAIQVADYFEGVYNLTNCNALKGCVDRYWTAITFTKSFLYKAIASYKLSVGLEASSHFGEQVARLTAAVEAINQAKINLPKTSVGELRDIVDKFANIVTKAFEAAQKDNDTIYHDIVPPPHKLQPIEKKSIAKALPLPEVVVHDPFSQLIPYSVKEDSAYYNDQKEQLLKKELDHIKFHDESAKATLLSMNLPGAVEALEIGVPKALQEKMDLVKSEGAIENISDLIRSLQQLYDEDASICSTAQAILDREEDEDNNMRKQYDSAWHRTPSYTLTANLRTDLAKYTSNLQHSMKSDSFIRKKFDDSKHLIAALESQDEVISLLPSNVMPLNQIPEVANLKVLIKSLDALIANRDSISEKLKQLGSKDDITIKLIHPGKDKNQVYNEEILKYEPLQQQLNDNFLKQEPLLDQIRNENEKFVKSNSKHGGQREETLQKFANAFKTYNELKSNLGEGIQFYTNFQEILTKFKSKCQDFVNEREKEKAELSRQISAGVNPYGGSSPSPNNQSPYSKPPKLVKKAVALDNAGKQQEAVSMYSLAIEHLYQVVQQNVGDQQTKDMLNTKIQEYTKRADYLRSTLGLNQTTNTSSAPPSFSTPPPFAFPSPPPLHATSHSPSPSSPQSKENIIQSALGYANKAVQAEGEGRMGDAITMYKQCSELLNQASLMESDIETRLILNQKKQEYSARADELSRQRGSSSPTTVNNSSNSFSSDVPFPQANEMDLSVYSSIELSASSSEYIDMAINYTTEAVKEDDIHNYSKAIPLYEQSVYYFNAALQCETNDQVRRLIGEKLTNSRIRCEFLKNKINYQSGQSSEINNIPFSLKPGGKYKDPVRKKTVMERLVKTIKGPKNISDHWL
eukprot:gene11610-13554_t